MPSPRNLWPGGVVCGGGTTVIPFPSKSVREAVLQANSTKVATEESAASVNKTTRTAVRNGDMTGLL